MSIFSHLEVVSQQLLIHYSGAFSPFEVFVVDGHSTKDIIVKWYETTDPLTVAEDLVLPEFQITSSKVSDCTTYYTTGNSTGVVVYCKLVRWEYFCPYISARNIQKP